VGAVAAVALSLYYGDPVPQSVRAKADSHGLGLHVQRVLDNLSRSFGPSMAMRLASPLALFGYALLFLWRSPARGFAAFALAVVAAYCVAGVKTWGWYFCVPLTAWCLAFGVGLDACVDFFTRSSRAARAARLPGGLVAALCALVILSVAAFTYWFPDRVTPRVYRAMEQWIAREGIHDSQPTILASDIGALGFFGRTRILDSEGLVWPEARAFKKQIECIERFRPDYLMLVVTKSRIAPFVAHPVAAEYEPLVRFNAVDDQDVRPDPTLLPTWWEQDYIVYRRRDYERRAP
jgi:hypothetical protein